MKLTEFGKVVRKARLDTNTSLLEMASDLGVSSPYLSGLETGRKKITNDWVKSIYQYFNKKGIQLNELEIAADVSNKSINLEGLDPAHQALFAGLARVTDEETISKLRELLEAANPKK